MPALLDHRRIDHHCRAVGSTVVLVFLLSLLAISFRIDGRLFQALTQDAAAIASMMIGC